MYQNAYDAITKEELWDWLKTESPPADKGFMFWSHPNLDKLHPHLIEAGHSGASFAMTMRVMEFIAKDGWGAFVAQKQ